MPEWEIREQDAFVLISEWLKRNTFSCSEEIVIAATLRLDSTPR